MMDVKIKKSEELLDILNDYAKIINGLDISNETKNELKTLGLKIVDAAMNEAFNQGCDYIDNIYTLINIPPQYPLS